MAAVAWWIGFRRMGWMISDDSGSNPVLCFTLFLSLVFFQKFSKYFCRINSVGKGRPAAGSIATAIYLCGSYFSHLTFGA